MRMHGHGAHDDMRYVPPEMLEEWSQRDPIETYEQRLRSDGIDTDAIRTSVTEELESETEWALAQPMPDPATATEGVFADRGPRARRRRGAVVALRGGGGRMPELTYLEAISDGLREEMRHDESVFCMGEDIGAFGGAFKVTDGFIEEFGADRVWDTPLAENAIVGTAVGAAVEGLRPVCEMQFADFIACGFDQLVNVAAKMHYRQGLAVPMVVRLPSGGGFSGGPFHSQNPEAWFLQAPGLKVVAPSTAEDAKGLLSAAIRDPNPVLYMEHKNLYRRAKGEVPEGRYETPMGELRRGARGHRPHRGRLRRDGAHRARGDAGHRRARSRCSTCAPCARSTARGSSPACARPARSWCCTRPHARAAWAPRCAALIAEEAFEDLDGPVVRVTAPDVPIPFSPPLERAVLPQVDDVKEACR